jgi:hypothetical protein
LIALLVVLVPVDFAKSNEKQLEKAVKKEIEKEMLDVDDKGKPSNSGVTGQANAAYKKATIFSDSHIASPEITNKLFPLIASSQPPAGNTRVIPAKFSKGSRLCENYFRIFQSGINRISWDFQLT